MKAKRRFTIEERIKPLVDALNSINYIHTISSCEGHFMHYEKEKKHANVIFEINNKKESDLKRLIFEIFGEVAKDFDRTIVNIYHRFYRPPGCEKLKDNWVIEITPNKYGCENEYHQRRYVDKEIIKITEIIRKYSKRNQPT